MISNIEIYGLVESFKASKYPMSVNLEKLNSEITPQIMKLAKAPMGTGHDNFLAGIIVQFDLTFTIKAWTEAQRYHFFQIISSQSTMHRITKFDLNTTYVKYVDDRIIEIMKEKIADYNLSPTNDKYLQILYSNPCGFQLTARITTNYRQLKTIYRQRKNHKLPEWQDFCKTVETFPYAKELLLN